MLMSNDEYRRIEVITGVARRRCCIFEESLAPREAVSAVIRRKVAFVNEV
jgi:hypothetical protein